LLTLIKAGVLIPARTKSEIIHVRIKVPHLPTDAYSKRLQNKLPSAFFEVINAYVN